MNWGGLCILATLQVIGFSLASPTFYRDDPLLLDHPMVNEELTTRGLLLNRNKRTPVLGIWYKPRQSRTTLDFTSSKPTAAATMEEEADPIDKTELDINDLNMTIRKLQMWEATLIRKYADRFKANKESLTENPIWQKLMRLRKLTRKLMKVYKERTSRLDTTRMKK
eukprot:09689.XXX_98332_99106_1 [CDS] Oithona nana genome sequencing.